VCGGSAGLESRTRPSTVKRAALAVVASLLAAAPTAGAAGSGGRTVHRVHGGATRHRPVKARRHRPVKAHRHQPVSAIRHRPVNATRHRAASGVCSNTGTPARRMPVAIARAAVLCLVNRQRAIHHLRPLRELQRLDRSAQGWTDAMVSGGFFAHSARSSSPGSRISAAGFAWKVAGENIATGYATPRQVVAAWMASPGHCRNILDPEYTDVGTGVDPRPVRGLSSRPSTWAQDFGLPAREPAPSSDWAPADGCPYRA
jgi:uncharacterized protein YkwD